MRISFLKSRYFLIAAPVIVAVCILQLIGVSFFNQLEYITSDWRVRLAHDFHSGYANNATNLGLVAIGDQAIYAVQNDSHLGFHYGLKWPRDVYASALKELTDEGAKAVAFDVLFADKRDDQAPVNFLMPDDIFASQLKASSNAILATFVDLTPLAKFWTNAWAVANITVDRDPEDGVLRRTRAFTDIRVFDDFIVDAAAQAPWELADTTDDRKARRITFFGKFDGIPVVLPTDEQGRIGMTNFIDQDKIPPELPEKIQPYTYFRAWAMGIQMAARELHLDLQHPDLSQNGKIILKGTNGLTRTIPVDDKGYFCIDWSITTHDTDLIREEDFQVLLAKTVSRRGKEKVANDWTNRIVVIGSIATGNELADRGSTPLESQTFLVGKHLNVANTIITGRFPQRTSQALNLVLIILVGIFAGWITWVVERAYNGTLIMLAFSAVFILVCVGLYMEWRIMVPIFLPLVCAGFVTHTLALVNKVRFEQSQKKLLKSLFSRVLSPDVVDEVVQKEKIQIDGQSREITVYFADVRGFTELTDLAQEAAAQHIKDFNLTGAEAQAYFDEQAKAVLATVSTYLGLLADTVKDNKGTLDKFIGDCVMAFWGAPLANPHHALDAVRAGIAAQRAIAALNQQRKAENERREVENTERAAKGQPLLNMLPVLAMGTGINSGPATVGFMGSEKHQLNYTAFGREVNLASRLEGVSGHGRIIIGETTYIALQRDDPELAGKCLEWAPRTVKGFRTPVRVYEVVWQTQTGVIQQPGENTNIRISKSPAPAGGEGAVKK